MHCLKHATHTLNYHTTIFLPKSSFSSVLVMENGESALTYSAVLTDRHICVAILFVAANCLILSQGTIKRGRRMNTIDILTHCLCSARVYPSRAKKSVHSATEASIRFSTHQPIKLPVAGCVFLY